MFFTDRFFLHHTLCIPRDELCIVFHVADEPARYDIKQHAHLPQLGKNSLRSNLCTQDIDVHLVEHMLNTLRLSRFRLFGVWVMTKVQRLKIIFANFAFYDSLGPTHSKHYNTFVQRELLSTAYKLATFVHADFNCTPQQLAESGWPKRLN